ncbi:serine hydrolase [Aestuariibius sp. HNIBRBA575]|uniref:D-alanyl-D-alanine carboxypeptidase family protein n=1 Tax=Aestuariibius sp. HNIBRBA575 TaxID=3233343 RepID=UPI0034A304D1
MLLAALAPLASRAAPYAALVMDARSGEVLHSRNADTQLHPASLTKMMTLYIAFEAVERGEIGLDTMVTIPRAAAAEPPSKLGLQAGQQIRFRYLIRAAAVKSANDAATAIGITISGSEAAFARRMNRTAAAMGMTRTQFKNAHGLTEVGHMSTARDMSILGRHMIYDWPQYYNIFSRRSADAGIRTVNNTNRRFLNAYQGADGIKTGYTRAAGFNLVASAERGSERIIATVFGGSSTANRNARVAELLDMGFSRAPTRVAFRPPSRPAYRGNEPGAGPRVVRVSGAVSRSLRPQMRTPTQPPVVMVSADILQEAMETPLAEAPAQVPTQAQAPAQIQPQARPENLVMAAVATPPPPAEVAPEIVTRVSSSGGRHWGINVGRYTTRYQAERVLLRVALNEMSTLDGSLRRVSSSARGHDANFMGLNRETAELACRRLQARGTTCFMIGPDS